MVQQGTKVHMETGDLAIVVVIVQLAQTFGRKDCKSSSWVVSPELMAHPISYIIIKRMLGPPGVI